MLKRSFGPAAIAITLALAATPAFAQREHDNGGQRRGDQQAQPRGGERRGGQRGEARGGDGGQARGTTGREDRDNRGENRGANRDEDRGAYRGEYGRGVPHAGDRGRAYVEPRGYGYARPRFEVPVRRFGRPYYAFRPRFVIGYGIYIGYPVPYPVMYGDPTYVYGYPEGGVQMPPPPNSYGGVSFDVAPDDAAVIIDGSYVGIARDFSPSYQPLTLAPGRHHVELQAPDMVPLAFDVDVVPGEVIPYRGALQPQ